MKHRRGLWVCNVVTKSVLPVVADARITTNTEEICLSYSLNSEFRISKKNENVSLYCVHSDVL